MAFFPFLYKTPREAYWVASRGRFFSFFRKPPASAGRGRGHIYETSFGKDPVFSSPLLSKIDRHAVLDVLRGLRRRDLAPEEAGGLFRDHVVHRIFAAIEMIG